MTKAAKITHSLRVSMTMVVITLLLSACIDYGTADWIITAHTVDTAAENGTITPSRSHIRHGETSSFSLIPAQNYTLQQVTGCRGSLSGNIYTTGAVTGDCTITAIFHPRSHWIDAAATTGGSIEPHRLQVEHGGIARFTLTPDTGFYIDSITGCGGTLNGNRYITGSVISACTISATFRLISYPLSATTGPGGAISPASVEIRHGDSTSFTLTPDTGYHIDNVTGCGGTLNGNRYTTGSVNGACNVSATFRLNSYPLSASTGPGGTISPASVEIRHGDSASFTLTPDTGYHIDNVTGCGGTLNGNRYITGSVISACTISATFRLNSYPLSATAGPGGTISPASVEIRHGDSASFTLTPDTGYRIDSVTGCGGALNGNSYTTGSISGACTVSATFVRNPPAAAASLSLTPTPTKLFRFSWSDVSDATFYRLLEDPDGNSGFTQLGNDIAPGTQSIDQVVPLYARLNARYLLQSCNEGGCSDSSPVAVTGTLTSAVGYFKASNNSSSIWFGGAIAMSRDGTTLAVGAHYEDSDTTGINGAQNNYSAANAGAVYIFVRNENSWSQQAYIKASNTDPRDNFGSWVSLSDDGNTLAVGAPGEDSSATGINGNQGDNSAPDSGAVYLFVRNGTSWSQQAYIKASNTDPDDTFGTAVSLSGDGNTLAVCAQWEDSNASGVNGDGNDNSATDSGAAYVFIRSGGTWVQQAYIKTDTTTSGDWFGRSIALDAQGDTLAVGKLVPNYSGRVYLFTRSGGIWNQQGSVVGANTTNGDQFGRSLSLSSNGNTLAVGSVYEDSGAAGINGNGNDNSLTNSGAAYVFLRNGGSWSQQAYIKASNPDSSDSFGRAVILSGDGNHLAVGAPFEDSNATGINGDENDNSIANAGAAYLFVRNGATWSQQAYIKASNTRDIEDRFGSAIALGNGTLAIGALLEEGGASGINNTSNTTRYDSGAVYLY